MKNVYRLNVRFDLDDPEECEAVEYLNTFDGKSRNRFIVSAVMDAIHRCNDGRDFTLTDIQRMFREELQNLTITPLGASVETSEAVTDNEVQNVLDTLEMLC